MREASKASPEKERPITLEPLLRKIPFGKAAARGYPPSPWSIGIINLGGNVGKDLLLQ